jgi:glycolate oxidase iron-sulfur subunit
MTAPMDVAMGAVAGTPLAVARHGLDACVHCGFCLQACPTYLALGDENDSPRGRLVLMRSVVEGTLSPWDSAVRTHIDRCLGCRACETACPSGVPYGELLEATRATITMNPPPPRIARAVLWVFARRAWLTVALAGARVLRATGLPALLAHLPGRFGFAMGMLAATRSPLPRRRYVAQGTGARGRVAVLRGCVMSGLYARTNRATARTLVTNDYAIVRAPGQVCCGALHAHAGDLETARFLARTNIEAFERSDAAFIAVNAAGCGAMLKGYGALLEDDPAFAEPAAVVASRTRDATELLADAGPAPGAPVWFDGGAVVTYDAPCHLLHAQRIAQPPLAVLSAVPGIAVVPLVDADQCCGSAGIYNLTEPELSAAVLAPKLAHIAETGASLVATGNPGCMMQIGAGLRRAGSRARTVHPVDLLDASYAARSHVVRSRAAKRNG